MSEQRFAVNTYQIDYCCDRCQTPVFNTGINRHVNFLGEESKRRYQHKCAGCGQVVWLDYMYPRYDYQRMER